MGFGLVNIPVKLITAVEPSGLDLDMLDKKNHANIKYKRVNARTGKEVPWENIVKGYPWGDHYVVLSDKDFEKASPEKTKIIEIREFVPQSENDSLYFDTPYYLEPGRGGLKAYHLLFKALQKTKKVALGSFVMRSTEHFCMLKPMNGNHLLLFRLRFPEQIREVDPMKIPKNQTASANELKLAVALINQLTPKKFSITKYKDTYTQALMKVIQSKAKGEKISPPKFKIAHKQAPDLMEQLKESLKPKKAS